MNPLSRMLFAALTAGAAAVIPVTVSSPAHADEVSASSTTKSGTKTRTSGCLGHGPARSAQAIIRTSATYTAHHVEGYSSAFGRGLDCQRNTGVSSTTTLTNYGHVEGRRLSSCVIGARGHCTIDSGHKYASWKQGLPKRRTSAGGRTLDINGIEVWSKRTGSLDDWYATARTTIYVGSSSATANATVHLDI